MDIHDFENIDSGIDCDYSDEEKSFGDKIDVESSINVVRDSKASSENDKDSILNLME